MATSGVYALPLLFSEIRLEILGRALQVIGVGETITDNMKATVLAASNAWIKDRETDNMHLWTYTEGHLFLQVRQAEYNMGDPSTHVTNKFTQHATAAAMLIGATAMQVDTTVGLTVGDNIGVINANNNLFWTTIATIPDLENVTLTDGVDTAINDSEIVYSYSADAADDFIPITQVTEVRRRESTDYEIPILFESRESYFDLPNKQQPGTPIQAYYSRQNPTGIMYVWSSPVSSVPVINFTYTRPLQIIVNDTEDLDFPDYWREAAIFGIAESLLSAYPISDRRMNYVIGRAQETLDEALAFDNEYYPVTMVVQQYG